MRCRLRRNTAVARPSGTAIATVTTVTIRVATMNGQIANWWVA